MRTVQTVRSRSNPGLKIQGIVLTMYDRRNNLSGQVAADVRENLGTGLRHRHSPKRPAQRGALPCGPGPDLRPTSRGSLAYQRWRREFLARTRSARISSKSFERRALGWRRRASAAACRRSSRMWRHGGTAAAGAGPAPSGACPHRPDRAHHPDPWSPGATSTRRSSRILAASIREKSIIQPLIFRDHPTRTEKLQIVAGERRWRASQIAGIHETSRDGPRANDTQVLELAIIENIQRADLNPVEEALGYRQLMDRFGHTQERLAEALGKSRSHIANLLRLLTLRMGCSDSGPAS